MTNGELQTYITTSAAADATTKTARQTDSRHRDTQTARTPAKVPHDEWLDVGLNQTKKIMEAL